MKNYENLNVRNLPVFVSSFFFIGFFPYGPGTAGSAAAFLLYIFLLRFLTMPYYLGLCFIIFIFGIYFSSKTEKISGIKDPPFVVIDEVLGYLLTVISGFSFDPFSRLSISGIILYAFIGLILFRFFDILKPYPIRAIDEKVPGGLGIMLDDAVAGVFSFIALRLIIVIAAGL